MIIKKFDDFLNEAYLKGGRQPLYHYTFLGRLSLIIESDTLKMGNPARPKGSKATCVTRSPYFSHDGANLETRIVLDYDKMRKDGYKSHPFDEVGTVTKTSKDLNLIKSHFPSIKKGKRNVHHVLDLPKIGTGLEVEFEERIYQDIKNIGKYIISIDFSDESNVVSDHILIYRVGGLNKYLEKYPHIKVKVFDGKNKAQTKDITDKIINKYKELENLLKKEIIESLT
jgi:hypothetical protein